ncbi:MAG TPA: hypothetical protein VGU63_10250 [Candidatus Acidoferrales bacterium]|nr:hypothetical protein [Candidatus Acidoferrales bacterium]
MESSFAENFYLPLLESTQNADGGWGFYPGSLSRVEPTCWAVIALKEFESREEVSERLSHGRQFLCSSQLPAGSWPATPEQEIGCWVSSLACWALLANKDLSGAVAAGLHWLCEDWPKDSSPLRRMLKKFSSAREVAQHNDSYRGWGWTPGTSSWVEPTSFALIAISQCPQELLPQKAARRQQLAKSMLFDRMCPGGGWNCGNPRTYGVDGESLVIPTSLALIALREEQNRPEIAASRAWLKKSLANVHGSSSLALARLCLETFGEEHLITDERLVEAFSRNEFLRNTVVTSWHCLAQSKGHR